MIRIFTRNSIYEIENSADPIKPVFLVTKAKSINPYSTYFVEGQTFPVLRWKKSIDGEHIVFTMSDERIVHTSQVVKIEIVHRVSFENL